MFLAFVGNPCPQIYILTNVYASTCWKFLYEIELSTNEITFSWTAKNLETHEHWPQRKKWLQSSFIFTQMKKINLTLCCTDATECSYAPDGSDYVGTVSHTVTGLPCQMWDSNTPHNHDYNKLTNDQNYCRNTDSSKAPWCMTMDPSVRWGYCDVPRCGKMALFYWYSLKILFVDFVVELIYEI